MQIAVKYGALLTTIMLAGAAPALASTFEQAVEHCRTTIGRPKVLACMYAQGKGTELEACQLEASTKVQACVQEATAGPDGRTKLAHAIAHCRSTVGLPIVQACLNAQGHGALFEKCRTQASPNVRACVRSSMIAAYGRANFMQAVEHCRETVGRPIVRECLGGRHLGNRDASSADLGTCRAKASPSVRACVRKRLGAA
jgi:hypothetical protein